MIKFKKTKIGLLSLFMISSLMTYIPSRVNAYDTLSENLKGYYTFDNDTTTTIDNLASEDTTNNGTLIGDNVSLVESASGKALDFNANMDSYMQIPDMINVNQDNFSISLWFNYDSDLVSGTADTVLLQQDTENGRCLLWLRNNKTFGTYINSGDVFTSCTVEFDTWQHLTITYDKDEHKMQFYINGVYAETINTGSTGQDELTSLIIGRHKNGGSSPKSWKGQIDEIRYYSEIVTAEKASAIYNEKLEDFYPVESDETNNLAYQLPESQIQVVNTLDGSNAKVTNVTSRPLSKLVDGSTTDFVDFGLDASSPTSSYVQLDLGDVYNLNEIKTWFFYADQRVYQNVVVLISETESFDESDYTVVFNSDPDNVHNLGIRGEAYTTNETADGRTFPVNNVNARYIRIYTYGSNATSKLTHINEIKVYGTEAVILPDVDKVDLGTLIDEAETTIGNSNDGNQYNAASFNTYLTALTNAQTVYENDSVTTQEVQQAYKDLRDAMDGLVDIEVLKENIAILEENTPTDKSEEWLEGYNAFINQLKELLTAENVTQEEVDAANDRIDIAEVYADLYEEVQAAKEIYEDGNGEAIYSDDSWNEFETAYTNALNALESDTATYDDIEALIGTVNIKAEALVKISKQLPGKAVDIVEVSNAQSGYPLTNIFDGSLGSYWHSKYDDYSKTHHYFVLKVPVNYYDKIELHPREYTDQYSTNGVFKEIKVYAKFGEDSEWVEVAHQSGLNQTDWSTVELEKIKADYLKVEILDSISDDSNRYYASLAEMNIYYDATPLSRANWKAVAYFSNGDIAEYKDTQAPYEKNTTESEGPAEYMFDGDVSSKFHTNYDGDTENQTYYADPIDIIIKLGKTETFNYVDWINRVDSTGCRLLDFDLYTIDDDLDYTNEQLKSGAPWVHKFSITADNYYNLKFYVGEQTTKYIKLVCSSRDSAHHLTCSELNLFYEPRDEAEEIKYTGMNTTLSPTDWIKESAYDQYREVYGYYGIVNGDTSVDAFSSEEANLVKYVDSSVLSVKAQSMVTTNNDTEVINVRFITSIASTNLENIRFKIEIVNPDGQARARYLSTNKVYRTIYADDVEISNAAQVMGNNISTYFAVCKLNNIPASLREDAQQTIVRVTPYWAPKDVATDDYTNYVEGIAREFTISELYQNASPSTAINE